MAREKRWSEERVVALKARLLAGEKARVLAAECDISRTYLYNLIGPVKRRLRAQPGDVFRRLTVLREADRGGCGARRVLCRCECGTEKAIYVCALTQTKNPTRSCGCWMRDTPNRKRTFATLNGRTQHRTAWAEELGIPQCTISLRLRNGLTLAEALTHPVGKRYQKTKEKR